MKPRLFHLVAQARQNLFRSADQVFSAELEVSGTQVVALFAIQSQEGCQLKDLTAQLQLKNSAVTGLVGRMEDNGLIQRRPCEQDGRSTRLYLTAKGRAAVAQAQPVLARVNAQVGDRADVLVAPAGEVDQDGLARAQHIRNCMRHDGISRQLAVRHARVVSASTRQLRARDRHRPPARGSRRRSAEGWDSRSHGS